MTDEEVMQQALDAMLNFPSDISDEMFESIRSLRARLAQPEPEPVAAWDGKYQFEVGNLSVYKHVGSSWKLLYTAPPQREFVGLTDEEREEATGWSVEHIEAKLKEKNGF